MTPQQIAEAEALAYRDCLQMLTDYGIDPDIARADPEFRDAVRALTEAISSKVREDRDFWKETASIESMARIHLQNDLHEAREREARLREALREGCELLSGEHETLKYSITMPDGTLSADPLDAWAVEKVRSMDDWILRAGRAALANKETDDEWN